MFKPDISTLQPPHGGKVISIQYLRAIAALMVVIYHAFARVSYGLSDSVNSLAKLGHGGVDLFFVISGFVIWSVGSRTQNTPVQFLLRRVIRVVPMYWVATFATICVAVIFGYDWIKMNPAHLIQSFLFLPHWSPSYEGTFWPLLVPGWTLIFEMFFYAVFAGTLFFGPKYRLQILTAVLLALVLAGVLFSFGNAPFHAYTSPLLLEFLAGCWIAQLYRTRSSNTGLGVAAIVIGLLVFFILAPHGATDQTSWSRPATFGIFGALIVFGAIQLEHRMPHIPLLERLGEASYSIYLFHIIPIQFLTMLLGRITQDVSVFGSLVFIIVSVFSACILGLWLFLKVERPVTQKLNAISKRTTS